MKLGLAAPSRVCEAQPSPQECGAVGAHSLRPAAGQGLCSTTATRRREETPCNLIPTPSGTMLLFDGHFNIAVY